MAVDVAVLPDPRILKDDHILPDDRILADMPGINVRQRMQRWFHF